MDFVDVKLTIDVQFSTMTMEQYNEFVEFFQNYFTDPNPINNKKVIDYLSLDKRPMHVARISAPKWNENDDSHILNSEIDIIC
jgi:hypothetical protein